MAYSMKLGINTMNYMFYGNNDSFVVFHTILDLPRRTAGWVRFPASLEPLQVYIKIVFICGSSHINFICLSKCRIVPKTYAVSEGLSGSVWVVDAGISNFVF